MKDTAIPAMVTAKLGKGTVIWVPWDLAGMYYRQSLPAHAGLFRDLVDQLVPQRQLKTSAHPLVEVTLMQQQARKLVHLVNLSGHSQTGYFAPLPMRDIRVELRGDFRSVRSVRSAVSLPVTRKDGYTVVTLPVLADYEVLVIE